MLPAALAERQWWPRSKNSTLNGDNDSSLSLPSEQSSAQGNSRKLSASMKFSTLTNAMGFKSKKHLSSVQGPPSRRDTSRTDNQTVRYTNRPPAKSVSSTLQSWDDPVEPQTPSDYAQDSNRSPRSMLATPESDPFFSNGIRFQPVLVHDPNRLSVYSGSSQSDNASKKNDMSFNRSSYASSSAQSHYHGPDLSPTSSATSLAAVIDAKPISPTKRSTTRQTKSGLLSPPASDENVVDLGDLDDDVHLSYPSLFKSGSSSTLTERKPPKESDPRQITNKPSRPRGMTDGGSTWSPQSIPDFLRSAPLAPKIPSLPLSPTSFSTPTHHRVIVRQPSASRVGPPSAPPSRNLPAPPSKTCWPAEPLPGSSSGISSTSAVTSNRELPSNQIVTRSIDQEWDRVSVSSKSSAGHTIRKAISHQSFSKRASNQPSSSTIADDVVEDRALRKQRSFHHTSSSNMPPLPPQSPPPVPPPPQPALPPMDSEASPNVERHQGSSPIPSDRKRLCSGGSTKRPSSQIFSPGGDDQQPVFTSGPTQEDGTSTLSGRSDSPALSARNEALSDPPPTSPDYTPQRIMSPLEMLRIEASWNEHLEQLEEHNVGTPREQAHSFTSTSTSMSRNTDYLQLPSTPKHYVVNPKSNVPGGADNSPGDEGTSSSPRHTIRLSTSQTNMSRQGSPSPSPTHSSFVCSSPGLPPPPRPRLKSGNGEHESSILSLSPRPLRRRDSKASTRSQPVRSIMKKPSFFVIDDERQRQSIPVLSTFAGSFLDLERGKDSFDTIRSEDEREG